MDKKSPQEPKPQPDWVIAVTAIFILIATGVLVAAVVKGVAIIPY